MSIIRVTGIDPTLRGEEVWNIFDQYGQITAFEYTPRLMEAIVIYATSESAIRAVEEGDGSVLGNSTIQVERIETHPTPVNVMGFSAQLSDQTLRNIFNRYGRIINLQRTGSQATITYLHPEGAATAIREANGRIIQNRTISVAPHIQIVPIILPRVQQVRSERVPFLGDESMNSPTIVTIRGLPPNLSIESQTHLVTLIRSHGPVEQIRFYPSRHEVEIDYQRLSDAQNAIMAFDDAGFNAVIEPETAVIERTIRLLGLGQSVSERRLRQVLSRYGRVDRINMTPEQVDVVYATRAAAVDARLNLDESLLSALTDMIITAEFVEDDDEPPSRLIEREAQVSSPRPEENTKGRRYLLVSEALQLINHHFVTQMMVDPENQEEVPPGLTRVTLIGVDGREYDVVGRYDETKRQILPFR